MMDARLLTILLAGPFFLASARAEEPPPPAAKDPGETMVDECVPPSLKTTEDSFQINPDLRQRYYDFLSRGRDVLAPRDRKRGPPSPESDVQFLAQGQFRLFTVDLFEQNAKLIQEGRKIAGYRSLHSGKQELRAMKKSFQTMEKVSNRLSKKLSLLISDEFKEGDRSQTAESYYSGMAAQGQYEALIRLLLNKLTAFEHRLCNFFFPSSHTVSLEDLSSRSTPYVDIGEIHAICRALSSNLPDKGVPRGLNP